MRSCKNGASPTSRTLGANFGMSSRYRTGSLKQTNTIFNSLKRFSLSARSGKSITTLNYAPSPLLFPLAWEKQCCDRLPGSPEPPNRPDLQRFGRSAENAVDVPCSPGRPSRQNGPLVSCKVQPSNMAVEWILVDLCEKLWICWFIWSFSKTSKSSDIPVRPCRHFGGTKTEPRRTFLWHF